jgi:uncharacterized protein
MPQPAPKPLTVSQRAYTASVNGLHRVYKLTVSPFWGQSCRFQPTCSDYMRDALLTHGPLRGGWLGVKRLCKCHPAGGKGFDPVPPKT